MDLMIPFNSIAGDRIYGADDIAEMFRTVITDGVHPTPGNGLQAVAAGGWNVRVEPGRCAVRGRIGINRTAKTLAISPPQGPLSRVDAVVIRCDFMGREITEAVKQGEPSSSPVPPELDRGEAAWELCLARILVRPSSAALNQADITDTRQDGALCGVMHSLIEVDPAGLFAQYGSAWDAWFDEMGLSMSAWRDAMHGQFMEWLLTVQDLLDGDAAANLAGAVADLEQRQGQLDAERVGAIYEIARQEGTVNVEEWFENMTLGLWEAFVPCGNAAWEGADVTVVIMPQSLKQPILGSGEITGGGVKLFAARRPDRPVDFLLIAAGRRN